MTSVGSEGRRPNPAVFAQLFLPALSCCTKDPMAMQEKMAISSSRTKPSAGTQMQV